MKTVSMMLPSGEQRSFPKSALRAIRLKCIDCSGGVVKEVRDCRVTGCMLWPFRMGHNPNRKGIGGVKQA